MSISRGLLYDKSTRQDSRQLLRTERDLVYALLYKNSHDTVNAERGKL